MLLLMIRFVFVHIALHSVSGVIKLIDIAGFERLHHLMNGIIRLVNRLIVSIMLPRFFCFRHQEEAYKYDEKSIYRTHFPIDNILAKHECDYLVPGCQNYTNPNVN
jgi:hypothetical protein